MARRTLQKSLLPALAAMTLVCGVAPAALADVTGSSSLTLADPTMTPRFFRSGTPGAACSTFSSGNFAYQAIPMVSDGSGTMTATVDPQTCGPDMFVTFHEGAFNPASICDGHVWSFGSSQAYTGESFPVTPNVAMTMVISSVQNAPTACGPFTYSVQGADPAGPTIPTLGEWAMFGMTALLAGLGLWTVRRRFRPLAY